jgi:hypothetical protein
LASPLDATSATATVTNMCGGLLYGTSFWTGVRDKFGPIAGHSDPRGTYWRHMSGGFVSTFLQSDVSYWNTGEWCCATLRGAPSGGNARGPVSAGGVESIAHVAAHADICYHISPSYFVAPALPALTGIRRCRGAQ